jgi:hypothetical protein
MQECGQRTALTSSCVVRDVSCVACLGGQCTENLDVVWRVVWSHVIWSLAPFLFITFLVNLLLCLSHTLHDRTNYSLYDVSRLSRLRTFNVLSF